MRNLLKVVLAGAVGMLIGAPTFAATVTIPFNGTDGVTSSLRFSDHSDGTGENGWGNFNTNTGSQQGTVIASLPQQDWYYPITLFRATNFSSIPAGATVNSVSLVIGNNWWNPAVFDGAEVRKVVVPGAETWQPGNGDYTQRNAKAVNDLGAGQWFASMVDNDNGIAWDGTLKDKWTVRVNSPYNPATDASSALSTLLVSGTLNGNNTTNTLVGNSDFVQLVQSWVNGGENDGFALSTMNATNSGTNATNLFSMAPAGAGLVIDYTAVPEPASLSLLALGGLALIRRRK